MPELTTSGEPECLRSRLFLAPEQLLSLLEKMAQGGDGGLYFSVNLGEARHQHDLFAVILFTGVMAHIQIPRPSVCGGELTRTVLGHCPVLIGEDLTLAVYRFSRLPKGV